MRPVSNDDDLRATARRLLPHTAASDVSAAVVVRGEFHDVVLLPGRAVVKVARGLAAQHPGRRAAPLDDGASQPVIAERSERTAAALRGERAGACAPR